MKSRRLHCAVLATLLTALVSGCTMLSPELRDLDRWMSRQPGIKKEHIGWATIVESVGGLPDGYSLRARAKDITKAQQAITDFRTFAAEKGYGRWRFELYWKVGEGESGVQFDSKPGTNFDAPFDIAQQPLPPLVVKRIVDGEAPNMRIEFRSTPEDFAHLADALTAQNVGSTSAALTLTNTEFSQRIDVANIAELKIWQQRLTALTSAGVDFKIKDGVIEIAHQNLLPALKSMRQISGAPVILATPRDFRIETEPQLLDAVMALEPALADVTRLRAKDQQVSLAAADSLNACQQIYEAIPASDMIFTIECRPGSSVSRLTGKQIRQISPVLTELAELGTFVDRSTNSFEVQIKQDINSLEAICGKLRKLWLDGDRKNISIEFQDPAGSQFALVHFAAEQDGPHGDYRAGNGSDQQVVDQLLAAWNATATKR